MMSYGVNSLDEAVAQGLIAPEEQLEFAQALDFVWRIRNELHFHTGTAQDRLTFKHQKHLAEAFGYRSEQQSGVLQFMQEYYGAASRLRRFLSITARVCDYPAPPSIADAAGAPRDLVIEEGQLFAGLGDPAWFAHEPARLMRVYWESARHGARISRSTERLVTQHLHLVGDTFHASDLVRRFFIAVCNRPTSAGAVLRDMANSGLLGRYFPEFSEIRGVLRYADFHHYPVDEHTLLAVESLARIPDLGGPVGGCLRESLENLSDPYIVVMAILFHDLGKAAGEVHVQESVERTRAICQRIGMPEEDTERIAFLVQHHMLMNNISQFRDTDDEHIVQSFANTVKTDQRLRGLLLLSFADLYAVGPNVWNDWKGTLLLQLYLKTVKRLLGRAETVGEEFWKAEKARRVVEATRDDIKNQVEDHLRGLGQRYFVAFTPDRIATHLACVAEARKTGLCVWSALNGGDRHGEVVICTRDRHGLFSELAGTFAAQLIDVNSAALFTRPDGYVVDCFTVTDARQRRAPTRRQLAKVERILREVLLHGDSIQDYVDRSRRRLFALLQPRIPVPTRIQFDNESSRIHTVIDIETGDRTGLLYDITRAMAEAGLNITAARVVTDARRVRDSFYVHKNHNRILDEEERETVRASIHNAIHPRSTAESKGDAR